MEFALGSLCHTFTIVGRCKREDLLGACITSSPLNVGARCTFVVGNVAAVATQAYTDPALGSMALRLLRLGYSPDRVIEELQASDEWSEYRQHAIIDLSGRTAAYTGKCNLEWRGHLAGKDFVALGNYLVGEHVIESMAKAFLDSQSEILEERLLRAIEAGRDAGGEIGGHLSSGLTVCGRQPYARTDLRVDTVDPESTGDAVDALRRLFDAYRPLIPYYEERPSNPNLPSWRQWIAAREDGIGDKS